MKTTLDLPDDLLIEAKAVAARRRTTLKDMVTKSLRREIGAEKQEPPAPDSLFEIGPLGILRIKKTGPTMSPEDYQAMIDESERADDARYFPAKTE